MLPSKVGSLSSSSLASHASEARSASQAQKISSSLAGEYALALLWPLSTVLYAVLPPLIATAVGALVVWPVLCFAVHYACPRRMPPRVSPAFILVDCFYLEPASRDQEQSQRRLRDDTLLRRVESPLLGIVRLLIHWLGTFSGYYLINLAFGPAFRLRVEEGLAAVWSTLGSTFSFSNGGLYVFGIHVLIQALIAMYQMRFFASPDRAGEAYKGPLMAALVYPWAAPHFSPGSFLWVTHASGLSSLTLMTATFASCAVSAVVAVFLYEGTLGRSAVAPATGTSNRKKFVQKREEQPADTRAPPKESPPPPPTRPASTTRTDTEINELD